MKKDVKNTERKLVFNLSDLKFQNDKSYSFEDNGIRLFFQKAKCIVTNESVTVTNEMYQNSYDYAVKRLQEQKDENENPTLVKLFGTNSQHSEKSQVIDIVLLCNGNELKKKFFISLSQIKEMTEEYIVFPQWIYDEKFNDAVENSLAWAKDNGGADLSFKDYQMQNIFEVVN